MVKLPLLSFTRNCIIMLHAAECAMCSLLERQSARSLRCSITLEEGDELAVGGVREQVDRHDTLEAEGRAGHGRLALLERLRLAQAAHTTPRR